MTDPAQGPEGPILAATHGATRLLTLHRPRVKNALDIPLAHAFHAAMKEAADDDAIRAVVITGAGSDFCGGADVGLFAAMAQGPVPEAAVVDDIPHAIRRFPKPIFAAVDGLAVGMAVTMLPFFDAVYATERTRFMLPFVRLGLVQEFGSSYALAERIGRHRMAEMVYTTRPIDGTTAERWGLVTRLLPTETLVEDVLSLCAEIAVAPAGAVLDAKRLLQVGATSTYEETLAAENEVLSVRYGGPDNAAAVAAFMARKKKNA